MDGVANCAGAYDYEPYHKKIDLPAGAYTFTLASSDFSFWGSGERAPWVAIKVNTAFNENHKFTLNGIGDSRTLAVEEQVSVYMGFNDYWPSDNSGSSTVLIQPLTRLGLSGNVYNLASGAKLEGATVEIAGQETYTDTGGNFQVTNIPAGQHLLTATSPEYYDWSESISIPQGSSIHKNIGLTPISTGSRPTVMSVSSRFTGPSMFSYFLHGIDFNVTFIAEVDWAGLTPGEVSFIAPSGTYDGTGSGDTFHHTFNMGRDFGSGGTLTVVARSQDGKTSLPRQGNFMVIPPPELSPSQLLSVSTSPDGFLYYGSIDPGSALIAAGVEAGVIPEDIPLFGGEALQFETILTYDAEITGAGTGEMTLDLGLPRVAKAEIAGFTVNLEPHFAAHCEYTVPTGSWQWGGFAGIEGSAEVSHSWPFVILAGPIPIACFFAAMVQLDADVQTTIMDWDAAGPVLSGAFDLEPYARGSIGAGVHSVLSVAGFLGGGAPMALQFPQEPTLEQLTVYMNAGIEAYAFLWHWEHEALRWGWQLYGTTSTGQQIWVLVPRMDDGLIQTEAELIPRDYIDNLDYGTFYGGGKYQVQAQAEAPASPTRVSVLQSSVFPVSSPSISAAGTSLYVTWLYDDLSRADWNRTVTVFSLWDGSLWSDPVLIADDGTADFSPEILAFSDGSALCAWEDASQAFPEEPTLDDMAASMDISVSHYDPSTGSWDAPVHITSSGVLDRTPDIAGPAPNDIILTWIRNEGNDLLGSATNPNTVYSSSWDGTSWG